MSTPAHAEAGLQQHQQPPREKFQEWLLFLFLTVVFFPALTIAMVSGYGFLVWMIHTIMGPPGPPG